MAERTTVVVERPRPEVAVFRFNRPEVLNAMSLEFVDELHSLLDEVAVDESTRVVVLTGEGRGFCSGHDLASMASGHEGGGTVPGLLGVQAAFAAVVARIRSIPQPVIAAVNGPAAGGGLAMALAADTRVCDTAARFNAAFVRLGISGCDVGVSYLLPRVVGPTLAFEMMLTGRLIDAEEALASRLVLRVVPVGEVLDAALAIADDICANAPFAIRMTKQVMTANFDAPNLEAAITLENQTQIVCACTQDHREAVDAFRARRTPVFENR
ncbi:MAG TPA: enoyl-CoA hydratase/isomerase family protein [Acidimicrobiales bacterium]|nr:enoyl-CoA hydratase/isomerase family protein [Acidimicrobiales bacterium]